MHTAATGGTSGWSGSGRWAWAHSERTLPGVSAPSRVVKSIMEMARSRACSLASALMLRVASAADRRSSPTWSTPGRPCRNLRSPASVPATSASAAGRSSAGVSSVAVAFRRGAGTVVVTEVDTTRREPGARGSNRSAGSESPRRPVSGRACAGLVPSSDAVGGGEPAE